jgi:hypothetical protein
MLDDELQKNFRDLTNAPDTVRAQHAEHADEVIDSWGDTDAFRTAARRTESYSKEDWAKIEGERAQTEATMLRLFTAQAKPDSEASMDGAEAMRLHIDRWYYICPKPMHAALADMYESDERFRAHFDGHAPGLAAFVAEAIRANTAR